MNRSRTLDGRRLDVVTALSGRGSFFCGWQEEHRTATKPRTSPNTLALRQHLYVKPSRGVHVEKVRPAKNRRLSKRERKAERRARIQANASAAAQSIARREQPR